MNENIHSGKYDALIKKIKRKRKMVIVSTIIFLLITITVCSPMEIVFFDETIVLSKGINPVITVLLVILIFLFELVAYALVSKELITSMDIECDPEKHLILNDILNKQKNKNYIYAVDFIYMGNFEAARDYADKMIVDENLANVMVGLFNKARCEFFLSDFDSLKTTVAKYEDILNGTNKFNLKTKEMYRKIQKSMNLLVALADEDKDRISEFRDIEAWNNSKGTQGYINYLKGIAAYNLQDEKEAIYRLMLVKENCEKTVFAQLAEKYISNSAS